MKEQKEAFEKEFNELLDKYRKLCPGVLFQIHIHDEKEVGRYEKEPIREIEFRF